MSDDTPDQPTERELALEAQLAEQARTNVLLRAGVDPGHPDVGFLLGGFAGQELDVEKVQAAATRLGILTPAPAATSVTPTAEELAMDREGRGLTGSGTVTPVGEAPPENPYARAQKSWKRANEAGLPDEESIGAYVQDVLQAGVRGDAHVIYRRDEKDTLTRRETGR